MGVTLQEPGLGEGLCSDLALPLVAHDHGQGLKSLRALLSHKMGLVYFSRSFKDSRGRYMRK